MSSRPAWISIVILAAPTLLAACDPDDGATLAVDLRTDLVPGVEFVAVRSVVEEPRMTDEAAATRGEDFFSGRRVAQLDAVPRGTRTLVVSLLDAGGETVVERRIRVQLDGALAVTALVTRDCREVACPPAGNAAATTCVGGRCAAPECVLGTEPECPDAECAVASDCTDGAACADGRCEGGVCFYTASPGACGDGEWCEPETGCQPLPDVDDDAGVVPPEDAGPGTPLEITSLTPRASPTSGGVEIAIEHAGDGAGLGVLVDGDPCGGVTTPAPGRARCTVPAHAAGTVDVTISNAAGESHSWVRAFSYQLDGPWQHGSADDDPTSGVAVGPDAGDVYVSGATLGDLAGAPQGDYDAYVVRYRADGTRDWITAIASPAYDYARDVAVGADGRVHVVGYTAGDLGGGSAGGNDVFVAVLDPTTGAPIWVRQYGTSGDDQAWDLAVDATGYTYVAVRTDGVFPGQTGSGAVDAAVLRIDRDGALVWARQLGTTADDIGHSIAVDPTGVSYLVGYSAGVIESGATAGGAMDLFAARYEPDGTRTWIRQRGGAGDDRAYDAAVGEDGSLFVVGVSDASFDGRTHQGDSDVIVLRFGPYGGWQWTTQIGSAGYESSWGISAGAGGAVYVGGVTGGSLHGQPHAGMHDGFVTRFDATDGSRIWTRSFGTAEVDSPSSCVFDPYSELVYVSLNTRGALGGSSAGMTDLALFRHTPAGDPR